MPPFWGLLLGEEPLCMLVYVTTSSREGRFWSLFMMYGWSVYRFWLAAASHQRFVPIWYKSWRRIASRRVSEMPHDVQNGTGVNCLPSRLCAGLSCCLLRRRRAAWLHSPPRSAWRLAVGVAPRSAAVRARRRGCLLQQCRRCCVVSSRRASMESSAKGGGLYPLSAAWCSFGWPCRPSP
jgi:hypothetical protein